MLIEQQNTLYEESLAADKRKSIAQNKSIIAQQSNVSHKSQNLKHRMNVCSTLVPLEEPSLHDDCTLIMVNHPEKGKIQFFNATDIFQTVYYWLGSFTESYFTLSIGQPSNYSIISPDTPVSKGERTVVMMNLTDTSEVFLPQLHVDGIKKKESSIKCPVCGVDKPAWSAETHASICANKRYVEVIESDSPSECESELPDELPAMNKVLKEDTDIIQKLKSLILQAAVNTDVAIKIKVRRNHTFEDFCNKMSKAWVKKQLGHIFTVSFYGESGIDQGGILREFFCGK